MRRTRRAALFGLALVLLAPAAVLVLSRSEPAQVTGGAAASDGRTEAPTSGPVLVAADAGRGVPEASLAPERARPIDAAADIPLEDRLPLRVLDLETDAHVGGVRIVWVVGRTGVLSEASPGTTSDAEGRVTVPRSHFSRLRAVGGWMLLRRAGADVPDDGRLHVVRTLTLDVQVSLAGKPPPASAPGLEVSVRPADDLSKDRDGMPAPFSRSWWDFQPWRGVDVSSSEADGRTPIEVPWAPRFVVKVVAPGCRTSAVDVEPPRGGPRHVAVNVDLVRARLLQVAVVCADGRPCAGATVTCLGKLRFPSERVLFDWWYRRSSAADGFHTARPAGDGEQLVDIRCRARSLPDGRHGLQLPPVDDLVLLTTVPGLSPDLRSIPRGSDDLGLEVRMAPRASTPVPVTLAGEPLPIAHLQVFDVTDPDQEFVVPLEPRDVVVSVDALVVDRTYVFLIPAHGQARRLRWDGRTALELEDVERDPREVPPLLVPPRDLVVVPPVDRPAVVPDR